MAINVTTVAVIDEFDLGYGSMDVLFSMRYNAEVERSDVDDMSSQSTIILEVHDTTRIKIVTFVKDSV